MRSEAFPATVMVPPTLLEAGTTFTEEMVSPALLLTSAVLL